MKNIFLLPFITLCLISCEVREEIQFNADGSGSYELGFDMTEMMKMGNGTDSIPNPQSIDTLINFATFLDAKKDSISRLSKEEQEKLEALRPLQFSMKMNGEQNQMDMRLNYRFKKLEEISKFAEAVKEANIKELDQMMNPMGGIDLGETQLDSDGESKQELGDFFSMAKSFTTTFDASSFSRKVTKEAIAEMEKKKDTSIKKDDPFTQMIRFKQVYRFPYRVKSVDNVHAKILSDFKGVELEADMYEANNDPEFFNIVVYFDQ